MKAVAYYRVSTKGQKESGLGLSAQKSDVAAYAARTKARIANEYTEIESGRKSSRPILRAAIAECRDTGAVLLIAKLDRLARSVHFISGLIESGVQFIAVDMPEAKPLEIQIHAAFAEDEARRIRERTAKSLKALKRQGVKLGNPNGMKDASAAGHKSQTKLAKAYASVVLPTAQKLRSRGKTLQEIADKLTADGLLTRRGKRWSPTAVARLLAE